MSGKFVLRGKVHLLTAALIGSGKGEDYDVELIKDSQGQPYIPITSLIGVLCHTIKIQEHKKELKNFWGYSENNIGKQSAIMGKDLICNKIPTIGIRDGIAIDHSIGIVIPEKKYNYEILEPGVVFDLFLEVNYDKETQEFYKKMLFTIKQLLEESEIHIGAKTNNGLGKIQLREGSIFQFDWSNKKDILRWFNQDFSTPSNIESECFENEVREFAIEASFDLVNSQIGRAHV